MFEKFKFPANLKPADPRFGCGPSLIPAEYVEKLLATGPHLLGTSHRKEPVRNICKSIQEGLAEYFSLPKDYLVVMGNGGATLLFDMIALGAVQKRAAHFTCGEFSSKWYQSSAIVPWIEAQEIKSEFGHGVIPTLVEGADLIAMTLNETSTGVQLANTPDLRGEALICVDATSGAGQVPFEVGKSDIFFFSPQKVFASEGGLFVAIMSPKAVARVLAIEADKSRYIPSIMSWKSAITNAQSNQTYNTPSISTLFFLAQQVERMNKLGYKNVLQQAEKKAQLIYGWAEKMDYLSPYVQEDKFRSRAVACIDVIDKLPVDDLVDRLGREQWIYGIDSYRKLGRNQFRISLFHNISYEDIEKLLQILSLGLESEL